MSLAEEIWIASIKGHSLEKIDSFNFFVCLFLGVVIVVKGSRRNFHDNSDFSQSDSLSLLRLQ